MKNIIITIQELLKGRNEEFDMSSKIKLVRQKDNRPESEKFIFGQPYEGDLYTLYKYRKDLFLSYQSEQSKGRFDDTEFIVSFIGEESTTSRFIGVFKNLGIDENYNGTKLCNYLLVEVEGFEILKEKVIIDWGKGTVSWHQGYNNLKSVIRIDKGMDENDVLEFKSYHDTVITYEDLKMIFEKNSQTWKTKLEAVNCIYLIQDTKNGKQYIGSTYGREGIWGRWKEYAKSGHGGNTELVNLVEQNNKSMYDFHWVILETLSINVTAYEAIEREALYKFKFQTIKFGYNLN